MKRYILYEVGYFPGPYTHTKNKMKFELDLANYTTKSDVKSETGVNTSKFAKEVDLTGLKSDIDDLDIGDLKNICRDLYNLSNVVEKKVVEKDVYEELVKKVNAIQTIDTSDLVKNLDYIIN